MERCNVCYIYSSHVHALLTEHKTWKDMHVLFLNEMDIEEHNRFSALNDALEGFEKLASYLSWLYHSSIQ